MSVVVQEQTVAGCLSSIVEPVAVFVASVEHYCCFGLPAAFELKLSPEPFAFVVVQPAFAVVQESLSDR